MDFIILALMSLIPSIDTKVFDLATYGNVDLGNLNVDDQDLAGRIGISD